MLDKMVEYVNSDGTVLVSHQNAIELINHSLTHSLIYNFDRHISIDKSLEPIQSLLQMYWHVSTTLVAAINSRTRCSIFMTYSCIGPIYMVLATIHLLIAVLVSLVVSCSLHEKTPISRQQ